MMNPNSTSTPKKSIKKGRIKIIKGYSWDNVDEKIQHFQSNNRDVIDVKVIDKDDHVVALHYLQDI